MGTLTGDSRLIPLEYVFRTGATRLPQMVLAYGESGVAWP